MTVNLKAIAAKFSATPEQQAEAAAHDARVAAHQAEQDALESASWHEGDFTQEEIAEFNRKRDEIDRKYGFTPTSHLLK